MTSPTGRLSKSEPAMQEITPKTKEGKAIIDAFVKKARKLVDMDFTEVEQRLLSQTSGFRDWSIGKCYQFMHDWDENEKHHAEQAALAMTCEAYGISYMTSEWVGIMETIARFEGKRGS